MSASPPPGTPTGRGMGRRHPLRPNISRPVGAQQLSTGRPRWHCQGVAFPTWESETPPIIGPARPTEAFSLSTTSDTEGTQPLRCRSGRGLDASPQAVSRRLHPYVGAGETRTANPDVAAYLQDASNYADPETGEVSRSVDVSAAAWASTGAPCTGAAGRRSPWGCSRVYRATGTEPGDGAATPSLTWAPGWWRRKADIARVRLIRAARTRSPLRSRRS